MVTPREEVYYQANGNGLMTPLSHDGVPNQKRISRSSANAEFDANVGAQLKSKRERCLGFVVMLNCVTIGLETDFPWGGWFWINQAMLVFYCIDLSLRLHEAGTEGFASEPWNWIDVLVVSASICEMWILPLVAQLGEHLNHALAGTVLFFRLLRLFRTIRVFTMVKSMKPLFDLLAGLSEAFTSILWLLVLVLLLLYAFALVFTQLLGHGLILNELGEDVREKAEATFATVPRSIYGLFRVMSADMTDLGPLLSSTSGIVLPLCYILFQMCATWLLLSTLTATVVNTMCQLTAKKQLEEDGEKAFKARQMKREQLSDLFSALQIDEFDEVHLVELQDFLQTPGNTEMLEEIASIGPHKALITWDAMQVEGAVSLDLYLDQLAIIAGNDVESSVMRLETNMREVQAMLNRLLLQGSAAPRLQQTLTQSFSSEPLTPRTAKRRGAISDLFSLENDSESKTSLSEVPRRHLAHQYAKSRSFSCQSIVAASDREPVVADLLPTAFVADRLPTASVVSEDLPRLLSNPCRRVFETDMEYISCPPVLT